MLTATDDSLAGVERARSRAVLGALAAELGHELQGPLNLFRSTVERVERGDALDGEDAASLKEELARLSRLSARLRQLARTGANKQRTSLGQLLSLAATAAGATAGSLGLTYEVGATSEHVLACDRELLSLGLAELLTNALDARRSQAGVRAELGERPVLCVWDDGPGFEQSFEQALAWGISTRPPRAGLGLTLALRAARAHGFSLEVRRVGDRTEVCVMIPHRELVPGDKGPT